MNKKETLQSLLNSGQGNKLEFKVRIPSKVRELTEQICAFANVEEEYSHIQVNDNRKDNITYLENE